MEMPRIKQTQHNVLKRKRDEKGDITTHVTGEIETPSRKEDADAKHHTISHATKEAPRSSEVEDANEAIGHMDNSLLSDHFAKQIKRHLGDLSTVELDEKYLPSAAFLDTSEFQSSRNLSNLPEYIEKFTPGGKDELKDTAEATSSPHTLFFASSGIRAADLTRFRSAVQAICFFNSADNSVTGHYGSFSLPMRPSQSFSPSISSSPIR